MKEGDIILGGTRSGKTLELCRRLALSVGGKACIGGEIFEGEALAMKLLEMPPDDRQSLVQDLILLGVD